jgi:NADH-quinone oxidoreductase subunit L
MITILIACSIGLPWIGALLVWLIGDKREKAQHWLSILFSVAAGAAAVIMLWRGFRRFHLHP